MEASTITTVILPLSLAIIMLGMGLSLVVDDFRRVLRYPRAVTIGLANQLIVLPLFAFALVQLFQLPPELAVGFMIIAACPGGATSNLMTHLARGDAALSITLTAVTSLITVFSIPLVVNFALQHFTHVGSEFQLPVVKTIIQIALITLIPVSLGMVIRAKAPNFALRSQTTVKILSTLFLAALIVMIILKESAMIQENMLKLGPVAITLNLATMAIGFYTARFFRLNQSQTTCISIEVGVQNGTLGIIIATSILLNPALAVPPVIYSILMFFSAGAFIALMSRRYRTTATTS
ncbi:bile acid:sodium symporter [Solemya pervernicosa gill symbiont]|uniref:Bile acid:sodium symporter n=2 Tax=Gammaproteobacteria incertae sedis TaxID=118884 RepID=A0A1T2L0Q2_9GAMM|nr:bile acid:sodium symporter family protein [Candidatus Reidiella endopervernicosa]OOZ38679.1 bile acid:sodium symporter [Solemya pervernicosa gill symbiont]QKQ25190.1 bile acid:sodium symporter family protein [Candidatus Reidiella endopervernicosa]